MRPVTIGQIEKATGGRIALGNKDALVTGVSTDSREAGENDLFIPLIGQNHDAHDFVFQSIQNGCRNFVVSRRELFNNLYYEKNLNAVFVEDTTCALQDLAACYLNMLGIIKVAVTGSTGKTTTKDMLKSIFSVKYRTYCTEKNFNNHIGVPLTIFSINEDVQAGIFEMGMDKLGEIRRLAEIVKPDIGIITNIGVSHIENLGSREAIFKAKMELTKNFGKDNTLIVYKDDEFLNPQRIKGLYKLITAGSDGKADVILSDIEDSGTEGIAFTLKHDEKVQRFELAVPGLHNAFNAAVAAAAGLQYGISLEQAADGLKNLKLTDKRLTVRSADGIKVIDDTYNASPDSMRGAIDVLCSTDGMRRVAVLGDMFELGEDSAEFHRHVGEYVGKRGVDLLVAIGENAKNIAEAAEKTLGNENIKYYHKKEIFEEEMHHILEKGDVVLVKGSRGMAMDEIVRNIIETGAKE